MKKNKFIVIEGIDGAGKSTITAKLSELFKDTCSVFFEPTRTSPFSPEIRDILSGKKNENVDELLELFKKDRIWNIHNNIEPSIKNNKLTILDRYYFSTAAYQGQNRDEVESIISDYLENKEILQPDFVFYLKLNPEEALARISTRAGDKAIFEKKSRLVSIMQNYDFLFSKIEFPFSCFIVDARASTEEITDFIIRKVFTENEINS